MTTFIRGPIREGIPILLAYTAGGEPLCVKHYRGKFIIDNEMKWERPPVSTKVKIGASND